MPHRQFKGWGLDLYCYSDAVTNTHQTRLMECKSRDTPGTDVEVLSHT